MIAFGAGTTIAGQQPAAEKPELVSPLGVKYFAQKDEKGAVAAAAEKLKADPGNVDNLIALGRAQAGIWRYHDAIETYSRGIKLAPNHAMLYRHRGHRYISTRQFQKATDDLEKAAKLNGKDFDIWYHLGLSYYLRGDFVQAVRAYERCLAVVDEQMKSDPATTDDSLVAVSDWLYMAYRRAGHQEKAARLLDRIRPVMNVKENADYHNRLLMYKGLKKEDELLNMDKATPLQIATLGYGVANWNLYNGRKERAAEIFRKITAGDYWPAFGFIAAEAEMVRPLAPADGGAVDRLRVRLPGGR
jgi:tetratricopeptide (TPR) repeat protein